MSGRRANVIDIREILRRVRLGEKDRATPAPAADHRCGAGVARALRVSRKTVKKYREWGEQVGLLEGDLPSTEQLYALLQSTLPEVPPPQTASTVEPYRELVVHWRKRGLEAQAIWQRLHNDHGFAGSYSAVWRFVGQLEPRTPEATVRIEVKPGQEAQVDFGYAGMMLDPDTGKLRKSWVFVMTLSWSRHQYVEFVFDQKVETWLRLHVHAFAYFGGVPRRIVLDNLKAAIIRASLEDPVVQRSYRELAEHYGFLTPAPHLRFDAGAGVDPCQPGTPEHKGKVENGVHYVKRNLLGANDFADVHEANAGALDWIENWAGQRIHGTTKEKPLVRFREVEQAALLPLPSEPYDLAVWKRAKVGRDCYVNFDKAYYTAPYTLRGQTVWVRGGLTSVGIYVDHELRALHPRAKHPGERYTVLSHLPPEKVAGLTTTRETCVARAAEIGPSTAEVVSRLLAERPVDRLPMVKRLLRLAKTYGELRLERACARGLYFDDYKAGTIRRILEKDLDMAALPPITVAIQGEVRFARSLDELLPGLGGLSWN